MATELRQQQREQTLEQPTDPGRRPVFWPFLVAALTVLVLGGVALMVMTQDATQPFDSEISTEIDGLTGLREAGPYVEVVAPVAPAPSIGDPMTGAREGGGYAPDLEGHHPPSSPDPMTAQREG